MVPVAIGEISASNGQRIGATGNINKVGTTGVHLKRPVVITVLPMLHPAFPAAVDVVLDPKINGVVLGRHAHYIPISVIGGVYPITRAVKQTRSPAKLALGSVNLGISPSSHGFSGGG